MDGQWIIALLIITLLSFINICIFTYYRDKGLAEPSVVPLEPTVEINWFDLADDNEFTLPYLNDEVHIEQVTSTKDSLERMPTNDDGDGYADKPTEK